MELLKKEKIERINSLIDNANSGSIPIIVYMKRGQDSIWYNRFDAELYFLKNGNINDCYKIQSKQEFMESLEQLEKEGWKKV